jgi:hypothetical protein
MWLRTGRERRSLAAAAAAVAALAMGGCAADYVEGDTSSILLLIENIADGTPQLSDVRGTGGAIVNCQVEMTVSARPKNPISTVGPSEDVRLNRYTVTYRRADGRSQEGIDVPFAISGNTTAFVESGGTSTTTLAVDLVRHQAKLEAPLMNITGLQVVTMYADISIFGRTISGKNVTSSGSIQVTFADFADGTTTCEG